MQLKLSNRRCKTSSATLVTKNLNEILDVHCSIVTKRELAAASQSIEGSSEETALLSLAHTRGRARDAKTSGAAKGSCSRGGSKPSILVRRPPELLFPSLAFLALECGSRASREPLRGRVRGSLCLGDGKPPRQTQAATQKQS